MKWLKYIVAILLVLFTCNWVYESTLFERYLYEHADQYLQVKKIQNCDVIYISASSNFPQGKNESNTLKISQFLSEHFPELQFEAINQPATHAGTYRKLLSLVDEDAVANTFIITMNLRSFGPSWIHSELETALNKQAVMYNQRPPLLNRFLVSLNAYDNLSTDERKAQVMEAWDSDPLPFDAPKNTVTSWCAQDKWGDWREPKRQLADQFIKQYGFVIDETNPRVQDFDAIIEIAKKRGWLIVFHILAENTQKSQELLGPELNELMRSNKNWLVNRYQSMGIPVVDNLEALQDEHFTDRDFPTEHYNAEGRKTIASTIALELRQHLK